MNRTMFLVDGFNVYHSLRDAQKYLGTESTRWLDMKSFLSGYLPNIGANSRLEGVHYFSALADHLQHRKPGVVHRHRAYIGCLEATGVKVHLGRFKRRPSHCVACSTETEHFEEKETDVAIATTLLSLLHLDAADTIMLVTGDTDLAPAVRAATSLFKSKQIGFLFPYRRKNKELEKLVPLSINIKPKRYAEHQFPNPFVLPSGRSVSKPPKW